MRWVGPVKISTLCERGIVATLLDERMTRSVLREIVGECSRYANLIALHHQIVGNLLFLRFEFTTGDASGHNMATLAADALLGYIVHAVPGVRYGSISGNFCTDKKATAVNGILGRGKNVVTELLIPREVVEQRLHTTAARVAQLNVRKNLIGTTLAGGIRSANAHYANMLLGVYLATGQDAANIVEGSQGITHAEDRDGDLYFSCQLPNLIVGTVGNGKSLDFVEANLARLGCRESREPGGNARRLAVITAAVLCGELSLLAAQTNPGELMRTHLRFERSEKDGANERAHRNP
nr:hydroxymethylglutaryl-CoA reductase [Nocardia crassostreae]